MKNGEAELTVPTGNCTLYSEPIRLVVEAGDWIVIEVFGKGAQYAITNPIFFEK